MVEQDNEAGTKFPSWTPELGTRIADIIKEIGSLKKAAVVARVSTVTIASWRDGDSEPRFSGMAALARAAGRSLEWLAFGSETQSAAIDGFSDQDQSGLRSPEKALGEKLRRSRETVDAAVIAADYEPPQVIWETIRTLVFKYDISIDDAAQLIDAMKHIPPPAPEDD